MFPSIQGESTLAGLATLFVRCTGCNLDCTYCDTRYARSGGEQKTINKVLESVDTFELPAVCITGGEPLLQDAVPELALRLISRGYRVSIETNGSLPVTALPPEVIAVIDVKCPTSGESGSLCMENIIIPRPSDEYKFVLQHREDFDFACMFIRTHRLANDNTILFSPVEQKLSPAILAEWILKECPEARLNLQLHRIIWPDETHGR